MRKSIFVLMAVVLIFSFVAASCAPAPAEPEVVEVTVVVEKEGETVVEVVTAVPEEKMEMKVAAIFPGVVTDTDYNTLAYIGMTSLKESLGVEIAYSESVPVPDVDRVMREYVDGGYNIIWTHGSQFVSQTVELAKAFPDVVFIAEGDGPVEDPSDNLWVIDRNFHLGFYAIGAVAARATETGKIGYLGGLTLPFSYAEVHAIEQAIADAGLEDEVELSYAWALDFNDPTKARQLADAMIADGVDVIMGSMNLGMLGLFEAVKASDQEVLVTGKYTDKSSFAPDNYLTSVLYDFTIPLEEIVTKIMAGETGGLYPLGFDNAISVQLPLGNVPEELNAEIEPIVSDLESGAIEVVKDITPIEE